ncbi:hypothetical protein GCM10027406_37240 [Leifsonia lichenia]
MYNINVKNVWYVDVQTLLRNGTARLAICGAVAAASITAAFVAMPAHADQVPGAPPEEVPGSWEGIEYVEEITVSPLEALPGGRLHVVGESTRSMGISLDFRPVATAWLGGFSIDIPFDKATGRFDVDIVVPVDATPGDYGVVMHSRYLDMMFATEVEGVTFTVLDPGTAPPTSEPTDSSTQTPAVLPPVPPPVEEVQEPALATAGVTDELAATGAPPIATVAALASVAIGGGAAVLVHRHRVRTGHRPESALTSE